MKALASIFKGNADVIGAGYRQILPLEMEADEAMQRCIDHLDNIEVTIRGKLNDGDKG